MSRARDAEVLASVEKPSPTRGEIGGDDRNPVGDILGTIEEGKWASVICWNGDPFSLESYPVAVYAEGKLIYKA